jgi:hypothetical protein
MKKPVRIANQLRALWKLCLSYRKRGWDLTDYPVSIRTQEPDPVSAYLAPRFKLHRYVARIVNWNLTGGGDSRSEALLDLEAKFEAAKLHREKSYRPLPRPGTHVPIEFASQKRIDAHPELAEDFIRRVLGLEWAWISDESSLWEFSMDDNNDSYCARIREIYGVDVSDIASANLAEILERIADQKPA